MTPTTRHRLSQGLPGARYQLQYGFDLSSGNWTSLGSPFTATGATLNATDSVTNAPQRFYRLVLSVTI